MRLGMADKLCVDVARRRRFGRYADTSEARPVQVPETNAQQLDGAVQLADDGLLLSQLSRQRAHFVGLLLQLTAQAGRLILPGRHRLHHDKLLRSTKRKFSCRTSLSCC